MNGFIFTFVGLGVVSRHLPPPHFILIGVGSSSSKLVSLKESYALIVNYACKKMF